MSAANICPSCQHENPADAPFCVQCGRLLGGENAHITTVPLTESDLENVPAHQPTSPLIYKDTLALFVAGQRTPILVKDAGEIILGRSQPGYPPPTVDLSSYHALGVSRQHAVVYVAEDGYSLEDLGSTNGTWLNGTLTLKHVPYKLHSGDQIRLGTLTLYVYFDSNHVAG